METNATPPNLRKHLYTALFKSLLVPLLTLAFFIAAPHWLNSKLRTQSAELINQNDHFSPEEKDRALARNATLDFQQICLDCPPGLEDFHHSLADAGIVDNFKRLRWGLILSLVLVGGLCLALAAIYMLNAKARKSQADLIYGYRLGWKIGMAAALAKVFLLIPLLAYGTFELTVLLSDRYYIKLLLAIILGGLFALWKSATILLKQVPLEFKEPMARELPPADAPALWRAVRFAAEKLQTSPPDHIIAGVKLNFYVTELAVHHDGGKTKGKTLYLSYPLLKQLSEDQVLAIIGHELGHFIGEDTRLTREFYPLRLKAHETMIALAQSGWIGWPSFQFLNYFSLRFSETGQLTSRHRELLADQKAALLTSPQITASALVRFLISAEAFERGVKTAIKDKTQTLLEIPLPVIVREQLVPDAAFWNRLFEERLPHPLDSHPTLHVRLESLGQNLTVADAKSIGLAETPSAYQKWFVNQEALFADLAKKADEALNKMRARSTIAGASYETPEGKELLNRHFPEKQWVGRAGPVWALTLVLALATAVCLFAIIAIDNLAARTILAVVAAFFIVRLVTYFKRHNKSRLTLNAGGIHYTGWVRPLRFGEIKNISAGKSYNDMILTFHLKEKQAPIWMLTILRLPAKSVSLSLSSLQGKQLAIAQTIVNYCIRQADDKTDA